jgi:hypothetical protein
MTRWGLATRAALAAVGIASLAALPPASAAAGGALETFSVTYSGTQTLDYAVDADAGLNCVQTGGGVNRFAWSNTGELELRVSGDHVAFAGATHTGSLTVATPGGVSEIKGMFTDEPGNALCDQGQYSGAYDCNASPRPYFALARRAVPALKRGRFGFQMRIRAYDQVHGTYSGPAPAGRTCTDPIGSDLFPGGAVWPALDNGFPDVALVPVRYAALVALATGRSLTIRVHDGHDMPNPTTYRTGTFGACECTVYSSVRRGTVVITRLS